MNTEDFKIVTNKNSKWDHSLLRRFNSTSHFRLINQLRNELQARKIQRKNELTRSVSKKAQQTNYYIQEPIVDNVVPSKSDTLFSNHDSKNKKIESNEEQKIDNTKTFKDRLNEIDLR